MFNLISSKEFFEIVLFSIAIMFSIMVITLANPVYAVLALICMFISIAFGLMLVGADFFAFILILVYVGAVMVLFISVVMTVPVKRNIFLHFRLTLIFFLITFSGVIFFYQTFSNDYIKVFNISPRNLLFSAYIESLWLATDFDYFIESSDELFPCNFLKLFASKETYNEFSFQLLEKDDLFFKIFLIFDSYRFVIMTPVSDNAQFIALMCNYFIQSLYPMKFFGNNACLIEVFGDAVFDDAIFNLSSNGFFISISTILEDRYLDIIVLDLDVGPSYEDLRASLLFSGERGLIDYPFVVSALKDLNILYSVIDPVESIQNCIFLFYFQEALELPFVQFFNFPELWPFLCRCYDIPYPFCTFEQLLAHDWTKLDLARQIKLEYDINDEKLELLLKTYSNTDNWLGFLFEDSRIMLYRVSSLLYNIYGVGLLIVGLVLLGALVSFTMMIDARAKKIVYINAFIEIRYTKYHIGPKPYFFGPETPEEILKSRKNFPK